MEEKKEALEQVPEQTEPDPTTLEEAFDRLDAVVKKLEDPSVSLEESMVLYQQGMKLAAFCQERIETAEKQLVVLEETPTEGTDL